MDVGIPTEDREAGSGSQRGQRGTKGLFGRTVDNDHLCRVLKPGVGDEVV